MANVPIVPEVGGIGTPALVMQPQVTTRYVAPPGYVIVRRRMPDGSEAIAAVEKNYARKMGLWRPRRKPPISAKEWRQFKTAARVQRKLERIAMKEVGMQRKRPSRPKAACDCKPKKTC